MSTAMTPVPEDHPLMLAWKEFKLTDEYHNSKKWASHPEHVEGSLWTAFMMGWNAELPKHEHTLVTLTQRIENERKKARAKYRPEALAPGGHPEIDVIDYAINELVGLIRYGEMIQHRLIPERESSDMYMEIEKCVEVGADMITFGASVANKLIAAREALLLSGMNLGRPEEVYADTDET